MTQTSTAAAQSPEISRSLRVGAAVLAGLGCFFWLPVLGMVLSVAPRFEEIFAKFNVSGSLAAPTAWLLAAGRHGAALGLAWLVVTAGAVAGAWFIAGRRTVVWAGVFAALSFVLAATAFVLIPAALVLPLIDLIRHVRG